MQKNGKKLLAWMLAASMVFSFSMPTQAAKKKPALSKKKAVITVGKTLTLKVKNISKKTKVTWKSKKKKIATVSKKGKVKAKKAGTAKITASFRYQGKKYVKTCKVTVRIMTTSSAGGFLCGYKPVVLAGSKEPLKIRHAHSYHRQALKGFSLCLIYWLTRKRVYVLFQ